LPGPVESGTSSTIEFHDPQASQRPAHFVCVAPQTLQENTCSFAMDAMWTPAPRPRKRRGLNDAWPP
jgi:hypothetical protein